MDLCHRHGGCVGAVVSMSASSHIQCLNIGKRHIMGIYNIPNRAFGRTLRFCRQTFDHTCRLSFTLQIRTLKTLQPSTMCGERDQSHVAAYRHPHPDRVRREQMRRRAGVHSNLHGRSRSRDRNTPRSTQRPRSGSRSRAESATRYHRERRSSKHLPEARRGRDERPRSRERDSSPSVLGRSTSGADYRPNRPHDDDGPSRPREEARVIEQNSDDLPPLLESESRHLDQTQRSWLGRPSSSTAGQCGRHAERNRVEGRSRIRLRSREPRKSAIRKGQGPRSPEGPHPAGRDERVEKPDNQRRSDLYDDGYESNIEVRPIGRGRR